MKAFFRRLSTGAASKADLSSRYHPDEYIAKQANMLPITDLLAKHFPALSAANHTFTAYGPYKGKLSVKPGALPKVNGRVVLVTAMTPTKYGEGKTCTSIGLLDGLSRIGQKAAACLREPSLGPVFGVKGGAAGGGYAQVVPMQDINLHFTGDLHAITAANNLLSACIDNHIYWQDNKAKGASDDGIKIDSRKVHWKRVVDMNDRSLRQCIVGLGGVSNGFAREEGFDITVASEVMAVFCLAQTLPELRDKLGNILIATSTDKKPVYVKDLGNNVQDAMTALLKDAFQPNVVQTLENNIAFIHGGPFANIAHGCNSVVATKMATQLCDYVVTEAGFGADLGAEKFIDIKCRKTGMQPSVAVMVATVRAIKAHGAGTAGKEIETGIDNLRIHCENMKKFNVPVVVALNRFPDDSDADLQKVKALCSEFSEGCVVSEQFSKGSEGSAELAERVHEVAEKNTSKVKFMYEAGDKLEDKIKKVAKEVYRATGVVFADAAAKKLKEYEKNGWGHFPICVAKTQYSFVEDKERGEFTVRDVKVCTGAEFVVVYAGSVMTMPGLPRKPSAYDIRVDDSGEITGLF